MSERWRRVGECNRCGDCCRHLMLPWPYRRADGTPDLDGDDVIWLNLHDIEIIDGEGWWEPKETWPYMVLPLVCSALTYDNKCSIYDNRPQVCRGWPSCPGDVALEPRCSYRFEPIEAEVGGC